MSDVAKYKGSCHCGKVSFEVESDLGQVISCNCSICAKKGHLLIVVNEQAFKLLSGQNDQSDYQFNKKRIHHLFCRHCGVSSFAQGATPDGRKMYAVNVRCLESVNLDELNVVPVDGKSF